MILLRVPLSCTFTRKLEFPRAGFPSSSAHNSPGSSITCSSSSVSPLRLARRGPPRRSVATTNRPSSTRASLLSRLRETCSVGSALTANSELTINHRFHNSPSSFRGLRGARARETAYLVDPETGVDRKVSLAEKRAAPRRWKLFIFIRPRKEANHTMIYLVQMRGSCETFFDQIIRSVE